LSKTTEQRIDELVKTYTKNKLDADLLRLELEALVTSAELDFIKHKINE